ncbi:plasmid replication protein, CyRepA1 family (plasmid) [Synechococcus elongatus PCC 11801]|uniref:Plasmid replication protein, CyRepA1 family n=1 Tax=Synechococcus elongatus PCC 11801 TaxID=2219813 RepID=A0ACD5A3K3_SYNEL
MSAPIVTTAQIQHNDRAVETVPALADTIRAEFVEASAISPDLFATAIAIVPDIEIDPYSQEVIGTPIADAINQPFTRFGHQAKPSQVGALFLQESGKVWQAKIFGVDAGNRSGQYSAPKGSGNRAYLPPVDAATRAAVGAPADGSFWDWVESHPEVPIAIVEGGKKNLAVLSTGTVAIGLLGCLCGNSPDLDRFLVAGRCVTVVLDQDVKPSARQDVAKGIATIGYRASKAGCSVQVAEWDNSLGKGIDDVIAAHGATKWADIQATSVSFTDWRQQRVKRAILRGLQDKLGRFIPALVVNAADLHAAGIAGKIPTTGIVAIDSPKGTGKSKFIEALTRNSAAVISVGDRESLQRANAEKWDLTYLRDGDRVQGRVLDVNGEPTRRIALCADSGLAVPVAEYPRDSFDLIWDEVDQVFRHLINGGTCSQGGKRGALIERWELLIKTARRILLASADVTAAELDYVAQLRGEKPWILKNNYQPDSYCCLLATGVDGASGSHKQARGFVTAELVAAIRSAVAGGDRVVVAVDTLKDCKAIAELGEVLGLTQAQILRFDSETSSEPQQLAYAADPTGYPAAADIRLLVYSPSISGGISMESSYFTRAFGFASGQSLTPANFAQSLDRNRQPIPRMVFSALRGKARNFSDAKNHIEYAGDLDYQTNAIANVLADPALLRQVDADSPAAHYHRRTKAAENASMANFALELECRLETEGKIVSRLDLETITPVQQAAIDEALELWSGCLQTVKLADARAIQRAEVISPDEAERLASKRSLSVTDRRKLERFRLVEFDPRQQPDTLTADDVLADEKGRRRRRIRCFEDIIFAGMAEASDQQRLEQLRAFKTKIPLQDLPRRKLAAVAAEYLKVIELIQWAIATTRSGGTWNKTTPEVLDFADWVKSHPRDAKIIGLRHGPNASPVTVVNAALNRYGIETTSKRDSTGDRLRQYSIDLDALDELLSLLIARAARHIEAGFQPVHNSLTVPLLGLVDGLEKTHPHRTKGGRREPPEKAERPPDEHHGEVAA